MKRRDSRKNILTKWINVDKVNEEMFRSLKRPVAKIRAERMGKRSKASQFRYGKGPRSSIATGERMSSDANG